MSIAPPRVVQSSSISDGWGRVFLDAYNSTPRSRAPVVLSLAGFPGELPDEDGATRQAVDEALRRCEKNTVAVSGMTIFPYDLWQRRGRPPCEDFHQLCVKKFFPRLKARDVRNRLGTYFERMMNYVGVRRDEGRTVDQLGFIIDLLKNSERWPRQSALQVSCMIQPKTIQDSRSAASRACNKSAYRTTGTSASLCTPSIRHNTSSTAHTGTTWDSAISGRTSRTRQDSGLPG
jgi:hypothetical protein